jgi:hypothetical protein
MTLSIVETRNGQRKWFLSGGAFEPLAGISSRCSRRSF